MAAECAGGELSLRGDRRCGGRRFAERSGGTFDELAAEIGQFEDPLVEVQRRVEPAEVDAGDRRFLERRLAVKAVITDARQLAQRNGGVGLEAELSGDRQD